MKQSWTTVALRLAPWLVIAVAARNMESLRNHWAALLFPTPWNGPSRLSPFAGEQVLGDQILAVIAHGRKQAVAEYSIEPPLSENSWLTQQVTASLWPARPRPDARWRFKDSTGGVRFVDRGN